MTALVMRQMSYLLGRSIQRSRKEDGSRTEGYYWIWTKNIRHVFCCPGILNGIQVRNKLIIVQDILKEDFLPEFSYEVNSRTNSTRDFSKGCRDGVWSFGIKVEKVSPTVSTTEMWEDVKKHDGCIIMRNMMVEIRCFNYQSEHWSLASTASGRNAVLDEHGNEVPFFGQAQSR